MCGDSPKPDEQIGKAALDQVALSKEMIAYYREQDAKQAPRQKRLDDISERLANQQIETSKFNDQQARETWDRFKTTGIPIQNAMNREAMEYDSEEALDRAAGEASNDVAASMSQAQIAQQRNLARMGVNPADGRSLAAGEELATTGALASAAAMNGARMQRSQMGTMLRKDAAGMAAGMPGTAAQTFGVAGAAGGQAAGAISGAISSANSITGTMGQGFTGAGNLNASGASILNQKYQTDTQAAAAKAAQMSSAAASIGSAI